MSSANRYILRRIAQGFVQHVTRDLVDEAGMLGQWNEFLRPYRTQRGMRPTQQCLDVGHARAGHVHLGLEPQVQFAPVNGLAQVGH